MKTWLENHWVIPAYSGAVTMGITLCFFGAAVNTMAGWLYAICGTIIALLFLGVILPIRALRPLKVRRQNISPVSAGNDLSITLEIENPQSRPIALLEVWDIIPLVLNQATPHKAIEFISPKNSHQWTYYLPTSKRGIYHWHEVNLRTGTPLGLFWCSRRRQVPTKAVVYPRILPLQQCPIIDSLGLEENQRLQNDRRYQKATEGLTRNLRKYRYGDPTKLIHWKTSARLGEFQVRELEVLTGGQEVIIALDTLSQWTEETFDRAITAAASLYFHASRHQLTVKLWTAGTGLIHGERVILETLAGVEWAQTAAKDPLPMLPMIWLTGNFTSIEKLPSGSRWLLFPRADCDNMPRLTHQFTGLSIDPALSLQQQLQKPPR